MAFFFTLSTQPVWYQGAPLVGARLRFYEAGTNTPRLAYRDGLLSALYELNNILTDGSGRIPAIWIDGTAAFRVRITTPGGVQIDDLDNLPITTGGGGGGGGGGDTAIETGDTVWSYRTGARTGWVRMNGLTIGSATSGATERSNADCQALFGFLYDQDPNLVVVGGRGASAAADWAAAKQLTLPDAKGRALTGLDAMGGTATGRLTSVLFAGAGTDTTLGSAGGEGRHTMLTAELPAHAHNFVGNAVAGHTHTGSGSITGSGNFSDNVRQINGSSLSAAAGTTQPIPYPDGNNVTISNSVSITGSCSITTSTAGGFTPSGTISSIGSATPMNNMSPFLLGIFYIKL